MNILFFSPEEYNFVLGLEKDLNVKINVVPHLVDIDPEHVHAKLLTSFKQKVTKFKDHFENKEAYDTIRNHIAGLDSGEEEKALKYLIDFYVKHQFVPPTKGSLLTGDTKMSTYKLSLEFNRQNPKIRYELKDLFEQS